VFADSAFNLIGTGGSGGLINGVNSNLDDVVNPGLATGLSTRPRCSRAGI
jgi:hypothetical protein